jgi:hypothetical protein
LPFVSEMDTVTVKVRFGSLRPDTHLEAAGRLVKSAIADGAAGGEGAAVGTSVGAGSGSGSGDGLAVAVAVAVAPANGRWPSLKKVPGCLVRRCSGP